MQPVPPEEVTLVHLPGAEAVLLEKTQVRLLATEPLTGQSPLDVGVVQEPLKQIKLPNGFLKFRDTRCGTRPSEGTHDEIKCRYARPVHGLCRILDISFLWVCLVRCYNLRSVKLIIPILLRVIIIPPCAAENRLQRNVIHVS